MVGPWVEDLTQGSHSESMHLCVFHGSSGHTTNSLIPVLLSQLNLKENVSVSAEPAEHLNKLDIIASPAALTGPGHGLGLSIVHYLSVSLRHQGLTYCFSFQKWEHILLFILSKLSQKDKDLDLTSSTSFSIILTVCP